MSWDVTRRCPINTGSCCLQPSALILTSTITETMALKLRSNFNINFPFLAVRLLCKKRERSTLLRPMSRAPVEETQCYERKSCIEGARVELHSAVNDPRFSPNRGVNALSGMSGGLLEWWQSITTSAVRQTLTKQLFVQSSSDKNP